MKTPGASLIELKMHFSMCPNVVLVNVWRLAFGVWRFIKSSFEMCLNKAGVGNDR